MTPHEGTSHKGFLTDGVGRGRRSEKWGKISDEVGFRRRILVKKKNLFYIKKLNLINGINKLMTFV
jgi:hypothetical protein